MLSLADDELMLEFDFEALKFTPNEYLNADSEDQMLEGDQLFCTFMLLLSKEIRASQTTSQRLAKAHQKTVGIKTEIPEHLQDFGDVFLKESFDALPNRKVWDHAIEIELGSKPANCKVYPLSPNEQTKLDAFLQDNLCSGHIHPSKSPMASPLFFIKKKDGSLQLVQDY